MIRLRPGAGHAVRHVDAEAIHAAVSQKRSVFWSSRISGLSQFRSNYSVNEKVQVPLARVAVRFAHSGPGRTEHRLQLFGGSDRQGPRAIRKKRVPRRLQSASAA